MQQLILLECLVLRVFHPVTFFRLKGRSSQRAFRQPLKGQLKGIVQP